MVAKGLSLLIFSKQTRLLKLKYLLLCSGEHGW